MPVGGKDAGDPIDEVPASAEMTPNKKPWLQRSYQLHVLLWRMGNHDPYTTPEGRN